MTTTTEAATTTATVVIVDGMFIVVGNQSKFPERRSLYQHRPTVNDQCLGV